MLDVLDRIEADGQTMAEVAARYGVSRSAVAGLLKRIRDDLKAADLAVLSVRDQRRWGTRPAQKPENRDGGMPARWWQRRAR